MKILLALSLLCATFPAVACGTTAKELAGSYTLQSGDTLFETFELKADNTFLSWLHERPEFNGSWHYVGCIIFIETQIHDTPLALKVTSSTDNQLVVTFDSFTAPTIFNKVIADAVIEDAQAERAGPEETVDEKKSAEESISENTTSNKNKH